MLGYIPKNTQFMLFSNDTKEVRIKFESGKYKDKNYILWNSEFILKDIFHLKNKKVLWGRVIVKQNQNQHSQELIKERVEVNPITHMQTSGDRNNFCNFLENKNASSKYYGLY